MRLPLAGLSTSILHALPYGVVAVDESGKLLLCNPEIERLFGFSLRQLLGEDVSILIPPPHRELHPGYVRQYVQSGQSRVMGRPRELMGQRADGSVFPIDLMVAPVVHAGQRYLIGVVSDVTERKTAEGKLREYLEQLQRNSMELERLRVAADAANRAKSEFLANISHELRTPLTAIIGFAEELLTGDLSTDEREQALRVICNNGRHLLHLINNILDVSKVEAGQLAVERLPIRLREVLHDVAATFQSAAAAKGLKLETMLADDLPPRILTDGLRLRQILTNLVSNALKFTERGRILIQARRAELDGRQLEVLVTDTGKGITADAMQRLFVPFSQADASTTRCYGGTGLGLAISRSLARLLGGDLNATSVPGEGSTFTLSLDLHIPTEPEIAVRETPADALPALPARCRVLVAEDCADTQRFLAHVLRRAGAAVQMADNGALAVEAAWSAWASGEPFDCILMDIAMPVLDGYGAVCALRSKGYEAPIVALTAHALTSDCERCLEVGCDEYATKPIDRRALLQIVARNAERWRNQHPLASVPG